MSKETTMRYYRKPTCGVCGKAIDQEIQTESIIVENCGPPNIKTEIYHRCCDKIWRYEISITVTPENTVKEKTDGTT